MANQQPAAGNDDREYVVVVNGEGQYSLWPGDRARPAGWNEGGFTGPRESCLDFIEKTWDDIRPLSAR